MSNASDFIIENGVLKKYVGPGGDVVIPDAVRAIDCFAFENCDTILTVELPKTVYVGSGIHLYGYGLFEECESLTEVRFGDAWRDHSPLILRPSLVKYRKNIATDHTEVRCNCIIHSDFLRELQLGDPNIYLWSDLSTQDKIVMASYYIDFPQKFEENQKKKCTSYLKRYGKNVLKYAIEKGLDPGEIIHHCKLTDDELAKFLEQAVSCGNLAAKAALLSVANSRAVCDKIDSKFDLDSDSDPSAYWEYRIDKKNKCCIIKRYIGKESSVVIPTTIDGYTVKIIEKAAFYGNDSIVSVDIQDGVREIKNQAFMNCENLEHIKLPESLTAIGGYVFSHCRSLTACTIPMGVTSIPNSAFEYCSNLETVSFLAAERIGKEAFRGCSNLARITIPKSVLRIEQEAFRDCSNLSDVDFEVGIERIGLGAFENCACLRAISIPDSVISIGDSAFCGCTSLTSITIPNSVTRIGGYTFSGCTSLTSVTIPNSVTSIGDGAFGGCKALAGKDGFVILKNTLFYYCGDDTDITIPSSVTRIDDGAFNGCTNLTSITIPDSVKSIGYNAFNGCESLTSITIPDSVTSIGRGVFEGCTSLTNITIPDSVTSIGYDAFWICPNLSIHAPAGSYAETYAKENNIPFVAE